MPNTITPSPSSKPAWLRVLDELNASKPPNVDGIRRAKLAAMTRYTGWPVIVHATACTVPSKVLPPQLVMMDFSDIKAFETVSSQLAPGPLDIILHTPGGVPEAVEGIVRVLRPRFSPVRFIVPHIAKSAGTMLAMSGNEILMHPNGELGPTDPQMIIGNMVASADAILAQFQIARDELLGNETKGMQGDPQRVALWGPILSTMGPALLVQCQNAKQLTLHMVTEFLERWMFAGDALAHGKAEGVATALNDHNRWLSHGRRVGVDDLVRLGVHGKSLTDDAQLLGLVEEVWAAVDLTLANTAAVRLTENHLGHAVIRNAGPAAFAIQIGPPGPQQTPA